PTQNERRSKRASVPVAEAILEKTGILGFGVDDLRDRIHAFLGVAAIVLAGDEFAELGRQFVGRVADPEREMRLGGDHVVDGPLYHIEMAGGAGHYLCLRLDARILEAGVARGGKSARQRAPGHDLLAGSPLHEDPGGLAVL